MEYVRLNGRQNCKMSDGWDLEIPTEFGSQMLMCVKFLIFWEMQETRERVLSNSPPQNATLYIRKSAMACRVCVVNLKGGNVIWQ